MYPDWVQEALDNGMVVPDDTTVLVREMDHYGERTVYIRCFPSRARWAVYGSERARMVGPTNCRTPEECAYNGYDHGRYDWVFNPLEVM